MQHFKKLTCTSLVPHSFQATVSWACRALPPLTPHSGRPRYRLLSLILLLRRKALETVTVIAATLHWTEISPRGEALGAVLRVVVVDGGAVMVEVGLVTPVEGVDVMDIFAEVVITGAVMMVVRALGVVVAAVSVVVRAVVGAVVGIAVALGVITGAVVGVIMVMVVGAVVVVAEEDMVDIGAVLVIAAAVMVVV